MWGCWIWCLSHAEYWGCVSGTSSLLSLCPCATPSPAPPPFWPSMAFPDMSLGLVSCQGSGVSGASSSPSSLLINQVGQGGSTGTLFPPCSFVLCRQWEPCPVP